MTTTLPAPLSSAQHDCLAECVLFAAQRGRRVVRLPTGRTKATMGALVRGGYLLKLMQPPPDCWAITNKGLEYVEATD